ncbi:MAG: S-methyl-5-thioribose-1-phosphate isomerase [Chloroflexota bacterium]
MRTVTFQDNSVHLIDQTALPGELRTVVCQNASDVASAIRQMTVRGAPAIGVAAACGMALDAASFGGDHPGSMLGHLRETAARLKEARPTAVNLAWAVDRMLGVAERELAGQVDSGSDAVDLAKSALRAEADIIADEDVATNRQMGAHGAELVQDGANVLTHCNTGSLATVEYGTALGVVRAAHEAGKRLHVFVDETRPFLQGARLTAWELQQEGIPHTLISDNMAGHFMMRGAVDLVVVGADRIAANGDVANKIGTYTLAVLCKENGLPFYVVAPTSTVDLKLADGLSIPIEERSSDEVTHVAGTLVAPEGTRAAHPAFDVTPNRYVTAIITEQGILRPPFEPALREAVRAAQAERQARQTSPGARRVRA